MAQGEEPADLILAGGQVVNVYSGEILKANVAVAGDRIAYVGPDMPPTGPHTEVLEIPGRLVAPGYIETHTHPYVLYNPVSLAAFAAVRGTTTLTGDTIYFQMQWPAAAVARLIEELRRLPARYLWWIRPAPNARFPGDEELLRQTHALLGHEDVVGVGEITNWSRVLRGEPGLLSVLERARSVGKRVDGHTAGASYRRLAALRAAGLSACHEAISAEEALSRLRLGYWTSVRLSSLRPDLPEIIRGLVAAGVDTRRLIFNMDAPNPAFLADHGFMDACLREAVRAGLPQVQAIQAVTLNAATYLGLDEDLGGVAPGRLADLLVLPDLDSFLPERVYVGGRLVAREGRLVAELPEVDWGSRFDAPPPAPGAVAANPDLLALPAREGDVVPVASFESTAITRREDIALPVRSGRVDLEERPDLVYVALIDRGGRWITRAVARHFHRADAIACTTVSTGHLLVTGRSLPAMARAACRAAPGGIVIVHGGEVRYELRTPYGWGMSDLPVEELAARYRELSAVARDLGYRHGDLLYSLDFLAVEFLPDVKVVPAGLVATKTGEVLIPAEPLPAPAVHRR